MAMAPLVGATVRAVSFAKIGIASGVGNMSRTIGTVFGVAIIVTVFTHYVDRQFEWAKDEAMSFVQANTVLRDQIKQTDCRETFSSSVLSIAETGDSRRNPRGSRCEKA